MSLSVTSSSLRNRWRTQHRTLGRRFGTIIRGTNEKKLELRVRGRLGNTPKSTTEYIQISDNSFRNSFSLFIWKNQFLFYGKLYFVAFPVISCYFKIIFYKCIISGALRNKSHITHWKNNKTTGFIMFTFYGNLIVCCKVFCSIIFLVVVPFLLNHVKEEFKSPSAKMFKCCGVMPIFLFD